MPLPGRWQRSTALRPLLPAFLATSIEEAKALAAIARPAYARVLAAHGQRLLYVTPWAPSGIWSRQALTDTAD